MLHKNPQGGQRNRVSVSELRKRMAAARASAQKGTKPGKYSVRTGTRGAKDAGPKMQQMLELAKFSKTNGDLALKVFRIYRTLERTGIELDVLSARHDHQILVNIANGILRQKPGMVFVPNAEQQRMLDHYERQQK